MVSEDTRAVAEALGVLLQRRFRTQLSERVTAGVHPAVDAATYPVFVGVASLGPVTSAALGPQIGLDRSVVSRRASRLVQAGLLTNGTDRSDGRASPLLLTTEGRRVLRQVRARLVSAVGAQLKDWSVTDTAVFAELLERFVEAGQPS